MNVWPLIHRELLVGARRRSTQWLRVAVASVAVFVGGVYIPIINQQAGISVGWSLFMVLVWMALAITGLFGVFFASDVISSERREGTLGLLFLTRLRGIDVVVGKFFSTTLRAAFALLAATPMLALPLLLGGVTFRAFNQSALVLANTLFFSVATGMMISSFNRNPVRAVIGTLTTILLLTGGTFLLDGWLTDWFGESDFIPRSCHASPAFSLYHATSGATNSMYSALATQHIIGWLFLVIAAWKTADHSEKSRVERKRGPIRWLISPSESPRQRRMRNRQPVQWLISHRSRGPAIVSLITLGAAGIIVASQAGEVQKQYWASSMASLISAVYAVFVFILFVWLAVESARRTGDSKSSGALELILSTPLTDNEIVAGLWRGVGRVFLIPLFTAGLLQCLSLWLRLSTLEQYNINSGVQVGVWIFGMVNFVATFAALIWVGIWLGLKSTKTTGAAALTFVIVVVIPLFLIRVGATLFFGFFYALSGNSMTWVYNVMPPALTLIVNLALIGWARSRLHRHFRDAANGTFGKRRRVNPTTDSPQPPALTVS